MEHQNVEYRIQSFLRSHRGGRLDVLTGYVSIWGLAWLQRNTQGRKTRVLVGDLRHRRFGNATAEERTLATQFLNRNDTELRSWYTKKQAKNRTEDIMHAKAWITQGNWRQKPAMLIGSANLTQQGLLNNFELMADADKHDVPYLIHHVDTIFGKSYDAARRVAEYINNGARTRSKTDDPFRGKEDALQPGEATDDGMVFHRVMENDKKRRQRSRGDIGW